MSLFEFVTKEDVFNALSFNVTLIDIRNASDYNRSHIHKAIHLPLPQALTECITSSIETNNQEKIGSTIAQYKIEGLWSLLDSSNVDDKANDRKSRLESRGIYNSTIYCYGNKDTNDIIYIFLACIVSLQFNNHLETISKNIESNNNNNNTNNSMTTDKIKPFKLKVLKNGFEDFYQFFPFCCIINTVHTTNMNDNMSDNKENKENKEEKEEKEEKSNETEKERLERWKNTLIHCGYPGIISRTNNQLFIGNFKHAKNATVIDNLGITHIVNITRVNKNAFTKACLNKLQKMMIDNDKFNDNNSKQYYKEHEMPQFLFDKYYTKPIKYLSNLEIIDNATYGDTMADCFNKAFEFIYDALYDKQGLSIKNNCVLIHCQAGVSRSSTIAMAYLIKLGKKQNKKITLAVECRVI